MSWFNSGEQQSTKSRVCTLPIREQCKYDLKLVCSTVPDTVKHKAYLILTLFTATASGRGVFPKDKCVQPCWLLLPAQKKGAQVLWTGESRTSWAWAARSLWRKWSLLLWLLHSCEGYLCILLPNDQIIHNLREVFMFFLPFHVVSHVRNIRVAIAIRPHPCTINDFSRVTTSWYEDQTPLTSASFQNVIKIATPKRNYCIFLKKGR